jgi:hypothetical protein
MNGCGFARAIVDAMEKGNITKRELDLLYGKDMSVWDILDLREQAKDYKNPLEEFRNIRLYKRITRSKKRKRR